MDNENAGAQRDVSNEECRPPPQQDSGLDGVPIPFASPRLLWRMKAPTHREKDALDLLFLRQWFAERGEQPPAVGGPPPRI